MPLIIHFSGALQYYTTQRACRDVAIIKPYNPFYSSCRREQTPRLFGRSPPWLFDLANVPHDVKSERNYSRYINFSDWDTVLLKKVNKDLMKSSKYGCESTGLRWLLVFAELDLIKTTITNFRSNRYYTSVRRNELPIELDLLSHAVLLNVVRQAHGRNGTPNTWENFFSPSLRKWIRFRRKVWSPPWNMILRNFSVPNSSICPHCLDVVPFSNNW